MLIKKISLFLSCLLLLSLPVVQAQADFSKIESRSKGTYFDTHAGSNSIWIGDFRYVFNASTRVHTDLTNFGTISSLKKGDRVEFTSRPLKDGTTLVTEIWVVPPKR